MNKKPLDAALRAKIESLRGVMTDTQVRLEMRKLLGVGQTRANDLFRELFGKLKQGQPVTLIEPKKASVTYDGDTACAESVDPDLKDVQTLCRVCKIDLTLWEIERQYVGKHEVAMREPATTVGGAGNDAVISHGKHGEQSTLWTRASRIPLKVPLFQVKVWVKKKGPQILAGEALLARIRAAAPLLAFAGPLSRFRREVLPYRHAVEIDIMDPHLGLLCQKPEADAPWDLELAEAAIMLALEDLIVKAEKFGPFEQAFMPFGNDFVHSDTVFHTTTAGTAQPEAISWHRVYEAAERVAIAMVDRLRTVAKELYIYEVPGNHSRMADFTLAHLLRAYFHNDPAVHVDCSASPYKFHRFGATLIGYEHGHSINAIRLASIMSNERRQDWAETEYREFHLGDQHRKASSVPSCFEEQGVSIEFIPGLTAPNEWHRIKGFNHQKRGAMAFVYDFKTGPIARFQHNISAYSHLAL